MVFAANPKAAGTKAGSPYFTARHYAVSLLEEMGLIGGDAQPTFVPLAAYDFGVHQMAQQLAAPFAAKRSAVLMIGERIVGIVGEYRAQVRSGFKLPDFSAGFELFLSAFMQPTVSRYTALPRFPKVEQDITLKVPVDLNYQELYGFVSSQLAAEQPERALLDFNPLDIYQRPDDPDHKQVTFRLSIASYDKTMTDKEVSALLDSVAASTHDELGAERI